MYFQMMKQNLEDLTPKILKDFITKLGNVEVMSIFSLKTSMDTETKDEQPTDSLKSSGTKQSDTKD